MAKISPFVEPRMVAPKSQVVPPNVLAKLLQGSGELSGEPQVEEGTLGLNPPDLLGAFPGMPVAQEPTLDPVGQYKRGLANLGGMPDLIPYRPASTVKLQDVGPAPEYDTEALQGNAQKAASLAAIIQGIAALGGAGSDAGILASKAGTGFFNGAKTGIDNQFALDNKRFMSDSQTAEKNYEASVKALGLENQGIDQQNDNLVRLHNAKVASLDRQFNIDSQNQRNQEQLDLKQSELVQKSQIEERRRDEAQLRQFVELAKSELLTPEGEAEAAKIINKLSGSGFSGDFLQAMTPEDRAKLNELSLNREQKAKLQKDLLESRAKIAKEHDAAVIRRQEISSKTAVETNKLTNETRIKVAEFIKSKQGQAAGPVVAQEMKMRLQAMGQLSGVVQRNMSNSARYEKMAQDILKNEQYQGRKSDPMGLSAVGYQEYQRLRRDAAEAEAEGEKNKEMLHRLQDSINGFLSGGDLVGFPSDSQTGVVSSPGSDLPMRSGYSNTGLGGTIPSIKLDGKAGVKKPATPLPVAPRGILEKRKVNGEEIYVVR